MPPQLADLSMMDVSVNQTIFGTQQVLDVNVTGHWAMQEELFLSA